jgi:hypothetical protein
VVALREYVQFVGEAEAAAGVSRTPYLPPASGAVRDSLAHAQVRWVNCPERGTGEKKLRIVIR